MNQLRRVLKRNFANFPAALRGVFFGLIYLLPAVLFFSYHPVISFGSDATMNFELSLPLIWLVVFALVSCANLIINRLWPLTIPAALRPAGLALLVFVGYLLFSVFWSQNLTRAVLTAGVFALTVFAIFALLYIAPRLRPDRHFSVYLLRTFFISSAVICGVCWLQSLLDIAGVSRDWTLLCGGCTYQTFGFPHPSGFAIEPQFMGNLLLAPTLLALYFLAFPNSQPPFRRRGLGLFAALFSATLFLTLSRGAIYAFACALVVFLGFVLFQHRRLAALILIPVSAFGFTLLTQGIFAELSPTADTFLSGTAKVVHQLSLGLVDFRPPAPTPSTDSAPAAPANPVQPVENPVENSQTSPESSKFDGYIPASTNIRLGISRVALQTWLSRPSYFLVGTGLGGAGVAMAAVYPDDPLIAPNAIVQNEPISLLLELGLIGIILLTVAFWMVFRPRSPFWRHPALPFFCALILAYLVTLQFFSGLANALQIYLLPPLLYIVLKKPIANLND